MAREDSLLATCGAVSSKTKSETNLPSCREGNPSDWSGKGVIGARGSDVVNAGRFVDVIMLPDFSSTPNSEDSRTNERGIAKRISGSVKTCPCSREK